MQPKAVRWETPFSHLNIWVGELIQREILTIQIKEIFGDGRWQIAFDSWEAYRVDSESNRSYEPATYETTPNIGLTLKIENSRWIESLSLSNPTFPLEQASHYEIIATDWIFGIVTTSQPVIASI